MGEYIPAVSGPFDVGRHTLTPKTPDRFIDGDSEGAEVGGNGFAAEGLVFPEHYLNNDINILALWGGDERNAGVVSPHCQALVFINVGKRTFLNDEIRRGWINVSDVKSLKSDERSDGHHELVLVGNVDLMKGVEYFVPARIGFHNAELLDDFFAGKCYLSMRKRTLKTLSLSAKRELNIVRSGGIERPDKVPCQMIERRPEVMDRVADYQGVMFGNGRVYIDAQGALTGIGIILDVEPSSLSFVENLRLGDKVLDVMLGPF